ncbi:MAG: TetR/AcrR family transcriptional regulator [Firmicutes bacterium]|nr:TetR/AcrR family transcriptional regulator [Bacillota bacterium]
MGRQAQRETTRRHLFDVALSLFRAQGFAETRVDEIIETAGVAKGTFYVHFPSKDAVLAAYADEITRDLMPQLPSWLTRPPRDAIAAVFEALNVYVKRDRRFIGDVIRVELMGDPWEDGKPSALTQILSPILAQGQMQGLVRSDLPVAVVAQHLLSNYLIGLAWIVRHEWPLEETMAQVFVLTVDGIWAP